MNDNSMTLSEFMNKYSKYSSNNTKNKKYMYTTQIAFLCQCKCGHVFDYRKRIKFENSKHYAPCQGRCPKCLSMNFTFIGSGKNVYPIKQSLNN